ncbi:MAG TPA: peptide-methionine (S)-S-oxide reductase MsrA [Thermoplasmata archaeon]
MSDPAGSAGSERTEVVTVGGGCFWCTEAVFLELRGVRSVLPGYAGGAAPDPSYEDVCTGRTGHAEVVEVVFDPALLPLRDLLRIFFTVHDPTTLNRQGGDVGTQYRSVIFYRNDVQRAVAEEVIGEVSSARIWKGTIVTEVAPFRAFYPAEEYHRDYFRRNPGTGYCQMIIAPKVSKFRKQFVDRLQPR